MNPERFFSVLKLNICTVKEIRMRVIYELEQGI